MLQDRFLQCPRRQNGIGMIDQGSLGESGGLEMVSKLRIEVSECPRLSPKNFNSIISSWPLPRVEGGVAMPESMELSIAGE